jgi:hypothetical protein
VWDLELQEANWNGAERPEHRQIIDRLEAARTVVERRFAHAGAQLETSLNVVARLLETLDTLASALVGDAADETTETLVAAARSLNSLPAARARRHQQLVGVRAAGLGLSEQMDRMQRTLKYIRVYAFNIKVAAAESLESAQGFNGFAEEMHQRIDLASQELAEFWRQLEALDAQIATGLELERRLEGEYIRLLPHAPDQLERDATAVSEQHRLVAAATEQVRALAQAAQMKVAGALSALQIGDITRQRIEHVQTGLAMTLADDPRWRAEGAEAELVQRLVIGMLGEQMADIADDFSRDVARMGHELAGVAADTDRVVELQQRLSGTQAGESGLRELEASVARASALIADVQAASGNADRIAGIATETAESLVRRVSVVTSVKSQIQRMALNTSLRCSRLGDIGKPLNVIAFELGFQARDLELAAGETSASLAALRDAAAVLSTRADAAENERGGVAAGGLDQAIAHLRRAADVVEKDVEAAAAHGDAASTALARLADDLSLEHDVGAVLRESAEALASLAGAPADARDAPPQFDALMDAIFALYTMERERTVHTRHQNPLDAAA